MKKAVIFLSLALQCPLYAMEIETEKEDATYVLYCKLNIAKFYANQELEKHMSQDSDKINEEVKNVINIDKQAWKAITNYFDQKKKTLNANFSPTFGGTKHTFTVNITHKSILQNNYLKVYVTHDIDESTICMTDPGSTQYAVLPDDIVYENLKKLSYVEEIISEENFKKTKKERAEIDSLIKQFSELTSNE